jgi:hypothetical protein
MALANDDDVIKTFSSDLGPDGLSPFEELSRRQVADTAIL